MNEELADKLKKNGAKHLSKYIEEKHTQEECLGFIDGYGAAVRQLKLLTITNVVGQSEQLVCEECKEPIVKPYAERYGKKFCLGCM